MATVLFVGQRTIEFTLSDGKTVSEEIASDCTENIVEYHLTGTDNEIWVVNDFNRVR